MGVAATLPELSEWTLIGPVHINTGQQLNTEHARDYSCPGATFAFWSHREVTAAGRVTRCCTMGKQPLEVSLANEKVL